MNIFHHGGTEVTELNSFLFVGAVPTNKKVSTLLRFLLAKGQMGFWRIGSSLILQKQNLPPCPLCLCGEISFSLKP